VLAGQVIYVRVAGLIPATGTYELQLDYETGDTPDTAIPVEPPPAEVYAIPVVGSLSGPDDLDYYRFKANGTGKFTVQKNTDDDTLSIAILDSEGTVIADNVHGDTSVGVVAGESYTLRVGAGQGYTTSVSYKINLHFEVTLNVSAAQPATGSSGDDFTDSANLVDALEGTEDVTANGEAAATATAPEETSLVTVGDSSVALVAVLFVGTGVEDLQGGKPNAQDGTGDNMFLTDLGSPLGSNLTEDLGDSAAPQGDRAGALLKEIEAAVALRRRVQAFLPGQQLIVLRE
jgi:hypothetical protein